MSIEKLNYAKTLAKYDSKDLLRALKDVKWMRNTKNLGHLKTINGANDEMDAIGDIGLTVKFNEMKLLSTHEGWIERLFGGTGEFYVVANVIDGSGNILDFKTQYFEGLKKGDMLPLGQGGMLITYLKNPRWFIDIHMVVMESDSDVRRLGSFIEEAKKEAKIDEVANLAKAFTTFDPTRITQILNGIQFFFDILVKILKDNKDDHVATIHDFYLKPQAFGQGRHPAEGLKRFQDVEAAYEIDLIQL